jgi:hypothetical protein
MKKLLVFCIIFLGMEKGVSQTIFSEDFSTISDLTTAGWTMYNDGFTPNGYQDIFPDAWAIVEWAIESPNITVSSTSQLDEGFAADRWLISPPISISSSIAAASLNFKANSIDGFPIADGFTLKISTTTSAKSSFTTLLTVAHTPTTSIGSTSFTEVNLAAYAGQTIYLAWVEDTLGGNILNIDDINVSQTLLSTPNFESSYISVYPNPASNMVTVSNSANSMINSIEMTDMNGRVVKTQNINAVNGQVSISDLSTGIYMMKIKTDLGTAVKKVIKE